MVQVEQMIAAIKGEAEKIDAYMRADLSRLQPTTDRTVA